MRVLLDECLPRPLKRLISGHSVSTVQERGWSSKKNGELLRLMRDEIDCFVTSDRNLEYQHDLAAIPFGIIVLIATDNRIATLAPLIPAMLAQLPNIVPGQIYRIDTSTD